MEYDWIGNWSMVYGYCDGARLKPGPSLLALFFLHFPVSGFCRNKCVFYIYIIISGE